MSVIQKNKYYNFNEDQVIAFTDSKSIKKFQGYVDMPVLNTVWEDDPEKIHLGLQKFFVNQRQLSTGMLPELLEKKQIMEVNGFDGRFTYSVPVKGKKGSYTNRDMSFQVKPGIDESPFKIALDKEYEPGDILTNDAEFGQQIKVTNDLVDVDGDTFIHTVVLATQSRDDWFLPANLAKGIQYWKLSADLGGEYGTDYSRVEMPDTVGEMKVQFQLGNLKGVEAMFTGYADKRDYNYAAASTKDYFGNLEQEADEMGSVAMIMDKVQTPDGTIKGKVNGNTHIASTLQMLVFRELEKITAQQLMFQRAATFKNGNSVSRLNEGFWHQLRRGKRIKYSRPGGITKKHIQDAVEYLFRGNHYKPWIERTVTFKVGDQAMQNVLEIFRDEVNAQMTANAAFITAQGSNILPKSTISSQDGSLQELALDYLRFTSVMLPGIGRVKIEHDVNLDYTLMQDRFASGMNAKNMAHTTYSMVIWDATDQKHSNNREMPKGATLADGADGGANAYLVKPKGAMTYWGTESGRYNPYKAGDIVSSQKHIAGSIWAYNSCAVHIMDLSRFLIIELDENARNSFN
ncbi:MAG: hypothetical protein CMH22_06320 [Methylophaga sp.]|nr:hypothetical protein [Methylophaga sp.]|tara:strand:- start:23872 stop:25590 length:1719 start_codon:yes stop_codon:yes gene_type:complete